MWRISKNNSDFKPPLLAADAESFYRSGEEHDVKHEARIPNSKQIPNSNVSMTKTGPTIQ
jgi:hypothetical protein